MKYMKFFKKTTNQRIKFTNFILIRHPSDTLRQWSPDLRTFHCTSSLLRNNNNAPKEITPVVVYYNADTQKTQVIRDNKGKSGIYRWINKKDNKSYIGSAISLNRRLANYYSYVMLSKEKRIISRALLKYGYSNFQLEILEYCDLSLLIEREQYYLDLLKPEYNILKIAGSRLGYRHTEETLAKFRARKLTNEEKAKIGATHKGKILSEETKERIRAAHVGKILSEITRAKLSITRKGEKNPMYGKIHSEETIIKLSAANGSPVEVLNTKTNEIKLYTSRRVAAEALSCNVSTISRYVKSGKLYKGIYKITDSGRHKN